MAVDIGFQLETDLRSLIMSIDKIIHKWEDDTGLTATTISMRSPPRKYDGHSTRRIIGSSDYFVECYKQGESNG